MFHTEIEALEFAERFQMTGATIGACYDRRSLLATLARAYGQFRFRYAGFATPDDSGDYYTFALAEAEDYL
jgi:hypothetical protein